MNRNAHELHHAYVVAIRALKYERTQCRMVLEGVDHLEGSGRMTPNEATAVAKRAHQLSEAITVLAAELPPEVRAAQLDEQ